MSALTDLEPARSPRRSASATTQHLAERALQLAAGCRECLVVADDTNAVHLRFADNGLTTNGLVRSRRLTVVGVTGSSAGVASRSDALDEAAVSDIVAEARRAAAGTSAEEAQSLVTGAAAADWDEPPAETDVGVVAGFATRLRAALDDGAPDLLVSGYAEQRVTTTYVASSTGLRLRHSQPTAVVDLVARRPDEPGSAWAGVAAAEMGEVDVAALRAQLERGLGLGAHPLELRPGSYEVLLTPSCVADLMLHVYRGATAREAMNGQGVFAREENRTRLGERIAQPGLTLRSDPNEEGLRCAPFAIVRSSGDAASVLDNGLPLTPTRWIDDGVLTALVQTRRTAEAMGRPATAEIDNLILEGPDTAPSLAEMVAHTERALLVTSLWYLRDVDRRRGLLTGVTRDGVYLVERGEPVAVSDFRFNESPVELLGRVSEIGRTERTMPREWGDYFTRTAMPPLRVDGVDVSAVSA